MKNMITRGISDDLHRALKIWAAEAGKTLQGLVRDVLEEAVRERNRKGTRRQLDEQARIARDHYIVER